MTKIFEENKDYENYYYYLNNEKINKI